MTAPLLMTKLYIPPVRPDLVSRSRLVQKLCAGQHRKLTLVSAPPGSGKTTLVSDWLSDSRLGTDGKPVKKPIAWLSLDGGDNDPTRFFAYLVATLQTVDERIGQSVQRALEVAQSPPVESLVTILINDIATVPTAFVLVLDDYHTITELAIHEAVGFLLERQPPHVHLVIITRQDPPLPLSRLRSRDQMTEIRENDLRFSYQEAATFLNESMGLKLEPSEIATLEARTEGWITGLQLAALSMRGRDTESCAQFISSFSGRHHFLLDYLTDEVLQRQPVPVQRFLLHTSILERMCALLCDAVLKTEGPGPGRQMLEQLETANLFTVPLDDERKWYRYHPLFAELLRARLQEAQPDLLPELHRRAAVWYERNDFGPEAVHHALATGDHALAAEVIEHTITRIKTWSRADVAIILGWLKALPEKAVRPRPWLRLFMARTLYVSGQPEAATQILQELEDWLRANPSAPDANRILGLVVVDRASYAAVLGNLRQAKELVRQTLTSVPEDDPIARFRAPAILGMVYFRAGDVSQASQAFSQAIDIALAADLNFAAVPFYCNLAEAQILQGQLRQAMQTLELAAQLSTIDGERIAAAGFVGLGLGKILYERNEIEAAEDHLREGLELLAQGGISEGFGSMHAVLAQVRQAQGDREGALKATQRAVQIAQRDNIPRLTILVSAYQARIWLAQGRIDLASGWASDYHQIGQTEYLREFEDLTLARLLLAEGKPAEALALLDARLEPAEIAGRMGVVIEVQALRALTLDALGDLDAAFHALQMALALAEPEGYLRVFVDMGEPMVALLKGAGSRGIAPHYVSELLAAFGRHEPAKAPVERQPLVEPLSDREMEVLQLLAEGLSNREIGRRLFISLPTVKSHTSSIYGKLGVHSRKQAVTRAEALGILSST